jgi:hypothetical protein
MWLLDDLLAWMSVCMCGAGGSMLKPESVMCTPPIYTVLTPRMCRQHTGHACMSKLCAYLLS